MKETAKSQNLPKVRFIFKKKNSNYYQIFLSEQISIHSGDLLRHNCCCKYTTAKGF